jgi:hypothetical protein
MHSMRGIMYENLHLSNKQCKKQKVVSMLLRENPPEKSCQAFLVYSAV